MSWRLGLVAAMAARCLLACGEARQAAAARSSLCVGCHGGADNQTGAPPRDLQGRSATSEPSVGAHSAHVAAGPMAGALDCGECHPKPADLRSPGHLNGKVDIAWGERASAWGVTPSYDASAGTCTVACHGVALGGGSAPRPVWTMVDGTEARCGACHGLPPDGHPALADGATLGTCAVCHAETVRPEGTIDVATGAHVNGQPDGFAGHPAGWMDTSNPGFHGLAAAQGLEACLRCHAAQPPAQVAAVTCSACHDALAGGDWTTTCNTCHGSAANAAPPRDTRGDTSTASPGVGAHQSHVAAAHGLAAPLDCTACHVKPSSVTSAGHLDGAVTIAFGALAGSNGATPAYDGAAGTCSVYCHGATLSGGSSPRPLWTRVDGSQAQCGSCHGVPPAALPSPAHPSYLLQAPCVGCHPATATVVSGQDAIVPGGGVHLNGSAEAAFAGHPAGWAAPATGGLHARSTILGGTITMDQYYADCTPCHGKAGDFDPAGGTSLVSCGACHPAFFTPNGATSCTFCH